MAFSEKDVRALPSTPKIALTDDELTQMTSYLNDAVQMLEPVLQYDLPDVEPTFHPIGSLSNVMGDDLREPERDLPLDVALGKRRRARDRYFRVPSILGEGGEQSNGASFDSLTAAQIAAGVAAGDYTATEVAQVSLAAIEAREGGVQAFLAGGSPSLRSRPLRAWMLTVPQASRCPRSRACRWPSRTT